MINWDDYRYVLAMERTGSLSAAARYLGVSQPTVSRRITELERALGVALVERLPDGYRLSPAGVKVCERARTIQQKSDEIQRAVSDGEDQLLSQVVVSAAEGVAAALVVPTLTELRASHPNISVELIITNRPVNLRRREADIAVRLGDPRDDTLIGRKVGAVEFGLYAHNTLVDQFGLPKTEKDLARFPFIESSGEISYLPQANWLRLIMPPRMKSFTSNSILNQLEAFKAGLGILALPTYLTAFLSDPVRILPDDFAREVEIRLMYHSPVSEKPGVRAVLDTLAVSISKRLLMENQF